MKNLFITLFLIGMSMSVCSQDYYWYEGTKIPLERGCRRYIIYEDDKLSESDKSHITYSEDVFYNEIPNLKWGTTSAHAVINDTAHVHYSTISYRKGGDYYDNMFITHRFYVKLKNQEDLPLLQELAAQNSAEIESEMVFPAWYKLRCKLDAPKNALELANLFYETTDLFDATEPEMINTILPEWPKVIKSLCDTWNVLHEPFSCMGPYCYLETNIYALATDTLIQDVRYVKLMEQEGTSTYYKGALREGTNRDIYYVPAGSENSYLLYAFNAQVGDELQNVWLGGETEKEDCTNAHNVTVIAVSDSNPRIFTLEVMPDTSYEGGMEVNPYRMNWIEGVGMSDGPVGAYDSNKLCIEPVDLGLFTLLCAYNDGEQVYSSAKAERYGCEFNGYDIPQTPTTDTIPLYAQDDPGSSTVDPVDPNQVVATLQGDQLTIHENSGEDITYSLQNTSSQQAPAQHRAPQSDTFRNEVTVQITESGEYLLQLTNPSWGYAIVGRFNYVAEGIKMTNDQLQVTNKVIMEGQLFIRRGKKVYTITGQQIQ